MGLVYRALISRRNQNIPVKPFRLWPRLIAYDQSKVAQIQKGVTTKQAAAALFGDPQGKQFKENGGETWMYEYSHTQWNPLEVYPTVKSENASLEISFDNRGIVQEYAVNNRS